jgi:hypothetical protein
MRDKLRRDKAGLWKGTAPLVTGARFFLFFCTALWVPVLLIPGDTTATSITYDTIRRVAAWLRLPPVDGVLSPGELLLACVAGGLTFFSIVDYVAGHGRHAPARVYLATIFWVGLATSFVVANPLSYGAWLFVGFALLSAWCLRTVRGGRGGQHGNGAG